MRYLLIVFQMDSSDRYCYDPKLLWNPQVEDYLSKAYGPEHFSRISKALTYSYFIVSFFSCLILNDSLIRISFMFHHEAQCIQFVFFKGILHVILVLE